MTALNRANDELQVGGEWDGNGHSSIAGRVALCEERDAGYTFRCADWQ